MDVYAQDDQAVSDVTETRVGGNVTYFAFWTEFFFVVDGLLLSNPPPVGVRSHWLTPPPI